MPGKNEVRIRKPQSTGHGTFVMLSVLVLATFAATQLGMVAQRHLVEELTPVRYRARTQVVQNIGPQSFSIDAVNFN